MKRQRPASMSARAVARRILDRARQRQRGVPPPIKPFRSGLPSLDALARQWWGLNLLAGHDRTGTTALAVRVALALAQLGQRVLWLDLGHSVDTPIFYLLTGISRVEARRVFPWPSLGKKEWDALEAAAREVGSLPIQLAELPVATPDEVRRAIGAVRSEGPLGLVVLDHVGPPERRFLQEVEFLAEELQTPVLAVVVLPASHDWGDEQALLRGDLPQRPGRLRLRLTTSLSAQHPSTVGSAAHIGLDVYRAGRGLLRRIPLVLDPALRTLNESS